MFDFGVKIEGAREVTRMLEVPEMAAKSFKPAFRQVRDNVVIPYNEKQFESEGAHLGVGWKALNPEYAKEKKKKYPGKPILRRKDRLYKSLTNAKDRDFIFETTGDSMIWGSSVPHAIFHQDPPKLGRPPQRKIIVITAKFAEDTTGVLANYMMEKVRKRALKRN